MDWKNSAKIFEEFIGNVRESTAQRRGWICFENEFLQPHEKRKYLQDPPLLFGERAVYHLKFKQRIQNKSKQCF